MNFFADEDTRTIFSMSYAQLQCDDLPDPAAANGSDSDSNSMGSIASFSESEATDADGEAVSTSDDVDDNDADSIHGDGDTSDIPALSPNIEESKGQDPRRWGPFETVNMGPAVIGFYAQQLRRWLTADPLKNPPTRLALGIGPQEPVANDAIANLLTRTPDPYVCMPQWEPDLPPEEKAPLWRLGIALLPWQKFHTPRVRARLRAALDAAAGILTDLRDRSGGAFPLSPLQSAVLLHNAAAVGWLPMVKAITTEFGTLEVSPEATPLALAARTGQVAVVKHLLSCGADPLHTSHKDMGPWDIAVALGHVECVRAMLPTVKAQVSYNDTSNSSSPGLSHVAQARVKKVWLTAAAAAWRNGHTAVALLLLQEGCLQAADLWDAELLRPLWLSTDTPSCRDLFQYLVDAGAPPPPELLLSALECGAHGFIRSAYQLPMAASCMPQLRKFALRRGECRDMIEHLQVPAMALDTCIEGLSPLHYCASHGNVATFHALLASTADNKGSRSPDRIIGCGNGYTGPSLLERAVLNHKERLLKLLLQRGEAVTATALTSGIDESACTFERLLAACSTKVFASRAMALLHAATETGKHAHIEALLLHGVSVNTPCSDGVTPLHIAVMRNCHETVRFLLHHHAHPSPATSRGLTPLHVAVGKPSHDVAATLLCAGADPSAALFDGTTPLLMAVCANNEALVRLLLRYGADVGRLRHGLGVEVSGVVQQRSAEQAEGRGLYICDKPPRLPSAATASFASPLHAACVTGAAPAIIAALLAAGADPRVEVTPGQPLLHHLLTRSPFDDVEEAVHCLLRSHAVTPASAAARLEGVSDDACAAAMPSLPHRRNGLQGKDIIRLYRGRSACHLAVRHGHDWFGSAIIATLLRDNAGACGIDVEDSDGNTPLQLAVVHSSTCLQPFLRFSDVNYRNSRGCTALDMAVDPETVAVLAAAGADINAQNGCGRTPLMAAVACGTDTALRIVEALLVLRPDVHAVDADGATVAHFAAQHGRTKLLKRLVLQHGADVNARQGNGATVLDAALDAAAAADASPPSEHHAAVLAMVSWLLQHGARSSLSKAAYQQRMAAWLVKVCLP